MYSIFGNPPLALRFCLRDDFPSDPALEVRLSGVGSLQFGHAPVLLLRGALAGQEAPQLPLAGAHGIAILGEGHAPQLLGARQRAGIPGASIPFENRGCRCGGVGMWSPSPLPQEERGLGGQPTYPSGKMSAAPHGARALLLREI